MSVNLPLTALQSANGIPLETVDDFKYLGSWVNSTNQDIRVRKAMAWKALNGMNVVWRSSLSRDLTISFFQATVESILLYGSECWSLNSSSRKSLTPECSGLSSISIGGTMFPTSPCTGTCRALQTGSPSGDSLLLATATGTGSFLPASSCYGSQPTAGGSRGDLLPPS